MRPNALFPVHDLRLHLPPGRDADVDPHARHGSNACGAGAVVVQKNKKTNYLMRTTAAFRNDERTRRVIGQGLSAYWV